MRMIIKKKKKEVILKLKNDKELEFFLQANRIIPPVVDLSPSWFEAYDQIRNRSYILGIAINFTPSIDISYLEEPLIGKGNK